jgi:hypothetical protein
MANPAVHAQNRAVKHTTQPNKSRAAAHESFLKKDLDADAAAVKKQLGKVSAEVKAGMQKASAELDKCGDSVKAGTANPTPR